MVGRIETVKIEASGTRNGWILINADEFDPKKHAKFGAKAAPKKVAAPKKKEK